MTSRKQMRLNYLKFKKDLLEKELKEINDNLAGLELDYKQVVDELYYIEDEIELTNTDTEK